MRSTKIIFLRNKGKKNLNMSSESSEYVRYEQVYSYDKMANDYARIVKEHPDKIPIVVNLPVSVQPEPVKPGKPRSRNYIVDPKESLQVLMRRLRDTLKIKETEAVFLMWGACMEPMAKTVGDIYSERKHPTGILIADLCIEQAFGAF